MLDLSETVLPIEINDIQLRFVNDGKDGLLAWVSCVVNNALALNNIALRRGKDGSLILTYPAKRTAAGSRFYYFNPLNSDTARQIEHAVLTQLRAFDVASTEAR